jgi:phospholipase/carboxylesterase
MTEIRNDYRDIPKDAQSLVILLHGYGSNGQDLISLTPYWRPNLPNTAFVSPDAPFPCEQGIGYQWYSLEEYTPKSLLAGSEKANPILSNYVEKLVDETGITWDKVVLAGFSQGGMMTLYTGPRLPQKVGGLLSYAGALVGGGALQNVHKPPVCLIHGEGDEVVPFEAYGHARQLLNQYGFEVSGHSTPGMGHSIDHAGVKAGQLFLQKVLGAT